MAGDLFVITDGTLQAVAQFAIPDGQEGQLQWLNFDYRSLVVRGQERDGGLRQFLHFFGLGEEVVGPLRADHDPGAARGCEDLERGVVPAELPRFEH